MQRVWCNMWLICNCLSAVYGFLKRIIFKFRKKKKIDEDLPISGVTIPNHPVAQNDSNILEWDDWGDGAPTSIRIDPLLDPSLTPQNDMAGIPPIPQQSAVHALGQMSTPAGIMMEPEVEPDIDYFADMTPKLKKPVLIRKKPANHRQVESNNTAGMALSSRLTMSVDPAVLPSSELSTWDDQDANTWEDEAGAIDLSWEAEQVIREKKQAERERRAAEQQRRKMEKEVQRASKKDTSKFQAVKLK